MDIEKIFKINYNKFQFVKLKAEMAHKGLLKKS
jgi:hypothetical protein